MKAQKVCYSQQCKLGNICIKHSLESLWFLLLCILMKQLSPSYCLILWFSQVCISVVKVPLIFPVEYIPNVPLRIPVFLVVKTHCGCEISRYQLSANHMDVLFQQSSTLTQGKEYASGLDGFFTSHVSEAWLSLRRSSTALRTKLSIQSQRLDVTENQSTQITSGHEQTRTTPTGMHTDDFTMLSGWLNQDGLAYTDSSGKGL